MTRRPLGRLFEVTFGRPRGVLGRVGTAVMVRANAELEGAAGAAGPRDVRTSSRARRRTGPAVELTARVPG